MTATAGAEIARIERALSVLLTAMQAEEARWPEPPLFHIRATPFDPSRPVKSQPEMEVGQILQEPVYFAYRLAVRRLGERLHAVAGGRDGRHAAGCAPSGEGHPGDVETYRWHPARAGHEGSRARQGHRAVAGARQTVRAEAGSRPRRSRAHRLGGAATGKGWALISSIDARSRARETPLRSTLAYLEREAARRAKGVHPGMMRLADDELAVLLEVLRREVGIVEAQGAAGR